MRLWLPKKWRLASALVAGLAVPPCLALPAQAQQMPYRVAPYWPQPAPYPGPAAYPGAYPGPYQGPAMRPWAGPMTTPQFMPPLMTQADQPSVPAAGQPSPAPTAGPVTTDQKPRTPQTPQAPGTERGPQEPTPPAATSAQNQAQAPEAPPGNEQASAGTAGGFGAPNMLGHLLFGSRNITFSYSRAAGPINILNPGSTSLLNPAVADDESPIPRDRFSFRFNLYGNAQQVTGFAPAVFGAGGAGSAFAKVKQYDVEEYTFYFEKTFLDGNASIEMRVPFNTGLSSDLNLSAGTITGATGARGFPVTATPENSLGSEGTQFGDITLILKALAYSSQTFNLTGGLSLLLPTGDDTNVNVVDYSGNTTVGFATIQRDRNFHVNNDVYSLSPFVAFLATPNERFFTQGFVQFDFPLNENTIDYTDTVTRGRIPSLGQTATTFKPMFPTLVPMPSYNYRTGVEEQSLMQIDWGAGYWILKDPDRPWITGIAPSVELHYTSTLQNAHVATLPAENLLAIAPGTTRTLVQETPPRVGNLNNRINIFDITGAVTFQLGDRATLATGVAFPLLEGKDRTFDWEYLLQFNYYFGGISSNKNRFAPNPVQ